MSEVAGVVDAVKLHHFAPPVGWTYPVCGRASLTVKRQTGARPRRDTNGRTNQQGSGGGYRLL